MKRKRGVVSKKELLCKELQKLAKQSTSLNELAEKIVKNHLKPYYRNKVLKGVWLGNKKFRLITLGIDKSKLKELTLEQKRLDLLDNKSYTKQQDRDLEQ